MSAGTIFAPPRGRAVHGLPRGEVRSRTRRTFMRELSFRKVCTHSWPWRLQCVSKRNNELRSALPDRHDATA